MRPGILTWVYGAWATVGATRASPGFSIDPERPANRAASHEHMWRSGAGDACKCIALTLG
jgi:hypothetical protein